MLCMAVVVIRMAIDPRIPAMPGRTTSGFHVFFEGGGNSFVAGLSHLTIDHASLSRRSTAPTVIPIETPLILLKHWAHIAFFCISINSLLIDLRLSFFGTHFLSTWPCLHLRESMTNNHSIYVRYVRRPPQDGCSFVFCSCFSSSAVLFFSIIFRFFLDFLSMYRIFFRCFQLSFLYSTCFRLCFNFRSIVFSCFIDFFSLVFPPNVSDFFVGLFFIRTYEYTRFTRFVHIYCSTSVQITKKNARISWSKAD